jgi:hypothetical protein
MALLAALKWLDMDGSFGCRLGPGGARGAQCRQNPQIVPILVIRAMDRRGHRGAQIDALLSFMKVRGRSIVLVFLVDVFWFSPTRYG